MEDIYNLERFKGSKRKILTNLDTMVWCGNFSEDKRFYYLDDAYIVATTGTTKGIREICNGPLKDTILDPIKGRATFFKDSIVNIDDCNDEAWEAYGLNLTEEEEEKPYDYKKIHNKTEYKDSEFKIVVLKFGWALVGKYQYDEEYDYIILHNSSFIKDWGTTRSLSQLCEGSTDRTVLDPNNTRVKAKSSSVLAIYDTSDDAWDGYRMSLL
jgi:hypothetical protein